ncbi:MAG: DUF3137 domain-containing protein [Paludibacteraceae bacterium]|nr:DUF3137 domain-containing protein [Paludibacteraceae bacterium]
MEQKETETKTTNKCLDDLLLELENKRKNCFLKLVLIAIGLIVFTIIFNLLFHELFVGVAYIAVPSLFTIVLGIPYTKYSDELKSLNKQILPKFMNLLEYEFENCKFKYSEEGCKWKDLYNFYTKSRLIVTLLQSSTICSEDAIWGTISGKDFFICESRLNTSGKKNSPTMVEKNLFEGIAAGAELKMEMKGNIVIAPNKPTILPENFKKVDMGNEQLQALLNVYTDNKEEAMRVFNFSIQERFSTLVNQIQHSTGERKFLLSLCNNKLYMLIPSNKDRFEVSLFSRIDYNSIMKDFLVTREVVSFIMEMNRQNELRKEVEKKRKK